MPDWKTVIRERLAPLHLKPAGESDLTEEIAHHLEDCYRELQSGGASEQEAYEKTLLELDDLYPLAQGLERNQRMPKHDHVPEGDARPGNLIQDFWRDLRYALRAMRHSPVFVVFAVLTLALGIGANTTVFTTINTLFLNPLPMQNTAELAAVAAADSTPTPRSAASFPISYADLKDY